MLFIKFFEIFQWIIHEITINQEDRNYFYRARKKKNGWLEIGKI